MMRLVLLLLAALAAHAGAAQALDLEAAQRGGRNVVLARGELGEGDGPRLAALIARTTGRVDELWLDAVTGAPRNALRLGRAVRELGLTTRIARGSRCSGACADVFLGGVQRILEEDRAIGLDQPEAAQIAPVRSRVEAALRRGGEASAQEAIRMLEAAGAAAAAERTRYVAGLNLSLRVVERTLALRADRLDWLLRSEARSAGFATAFE